MSEVKSEVIIDGVVYVPKVAMEATDYVIVRTYSAGVFAGYIEKASEDGKKVTMRNVRCLWYWEGAASLMQLSADGTCKPENCKFTKAIDKIKLTEVIEVLYCTQKAAEQIKEIDAWIIR